MAVPAINRGPQGMPGTIGYPTGITAGIFNDVDMVIPDWIPKLIGKYGNDDYFMINQILGRTVLEDASTQTGTFSHFEKGRIFGAGIVNANVASGAVGAAVTITFKSPDSYNNAAGTQSPFMNEQTVKFRSNGLKFTISGIVRTANAFTGVLTPMGAYAVQSGTSGGFVLAGEGIETFGNQLAGESSGQQGTWQPQITRYDNTATVIRCSVKASDLAGMTKTQIDFGGSSYEPFLAVKTMNQTMMANIADAVLEGVPYSNTTRIGTLGVIPEVVARGGDISYTQNNFTISDFQNLTRSFDYNGGPSEYHGLQDIRQRQDINNLLFGLYPNGMINYGSVGENAEAAVSYGFKSFSTDTYTFHFHRFKGFSPESVFGYAPTVGNYREYFGLFIPQGEVRDAKLNVGRPFMQVVYQQNPDIPKGQKIYSWDMGYTRDTKTLEASNSYEQIAYVGSRVAAAEQFALLRGYAQ